MSYLVIYQQAGAPQNFELSDTIHQAVSAVERLRNNENAENVRIFRLEEVPFKYKVRYEVEITDPSLAEEATESSPDFESDSLVSSQQPETDASSTVDTDERPSWGDPVTASEDGTSPAESVSSDTFSSPFGQRKGLFGR